MPIVSNLDSTPIFLEGRNAKNVGHDLSACVYDFSSVFVWLYSCSLALCDRLTKTVLVIYLLLYESHASSSQGTCFLLPLVFFYKLVHSCVANTLIKYWHQLTLRFPFSSDAPSHVLKMNKNCCVVTSSECVADKKCSSFPFINLECLQVIQKFKTLRDRFNLRIVFAFNIDNAFNFTAYLSFFRWY